MRPTLAICIPTFERAALLERLLLALETEPGSEGLPILVADNASTDGTAAVLERAAARLPTLAVHRHGENLGPVENLRWLYEHAPSADYVWTIGDDDLPVAGALACVLALLRERKPHLLHLPHLWRRDGVVTAESPCPAAVEEHAGSRDLVLAYHHWPTFISTVVVRREPLREAVRAYPTRNVWAPYLWYQAAARDGACLVADRRLVVGSPDVGWAERRALLMTEQVVALYDEGLSDLLSPREFATILDGFYEHDVYLDCWAQRPLEELERAVVRFPWSRELRWTLWRCALDAGRLDEVVGTLRQAAAAADARAAAAALRSGAESAFEAGDPVGAVRDLEVAVRLEPTYADAWSDLGVAYHAVCRPDAEQALDRALALEPAHGLALLNRAHLHATEQRPERAAADARRLLELEPGNREAADLLAALAPGARPRPTAAMRAFAAQFPWERETILDFVCETAGALPAGARVLDVGAGEAPYRELFAHVDYRTSDWANSVHPGARAVDYVGSADDLPVEDASFDAVLCTQVLEHVAEPLDVLRELRRVLVPGGRLFLTVPLAWELHEEPYDFWRYTSHGLAHLLDRAGFADARIEARNDCFSTIAQLMHNASDAMGRAPDGLDPQRERAAQTLRELAAVVAGFAPLDARRILPLGYSVVARRP